MTDVLIIGGGLSGLINAILLGRSGLSVKLLEKKTYPFHRVCGEYISNEVIPFLEKHDLFPSEFEPTQIERLQLTSTRGHSFQQKLDLGGFGISRYVYDQWLANKARKSGVDLMEDCTATNISFDDNHFQVQTKSGDQHTARFIISAHGKRSMLDKTLNRPFLDKKSPYVGVKYHANVSFDPGLIALHNFHGGYCGVSMIEGGKVNICYMTHRDEVRKYGNIGEFEKHILFKNPHLKSLFETAEFLFEKPEVINEINFEKKEPVYEHILLSGDSAGSITPLCGNGMALAIHAAKMLSETIITHWNDENFNRADIESSYAENWNKVFSSRLWTGRQIQNLFGNDLVSEIAVFTGKYIKPVANGLIQKTHGQPFS